ncbi:hypothetical protein Tco_1363164 [Tanacetum coccineum]
MPPTPPPHHHPLLHDTIAYTSSSPSTPSSSSYTPSSHAIFTLITFISTATLHSRTTIHTDATTPIAPPSTSRHPYLRPIRVRGGAFGFSDATVGTVGIMVQD